MGASGWSYTVPYQPDLNAALHELRERVFAEGRYYWAVGDYCPARDDVDPEQRAACPPPASFAELWDNDLVAQEGTHSILDVDRVLAAGAEPRMCAIEPVSAEEARERTGTDRLTREHLPAIDDLVRGRWTGRCAVLHDAAGNPTELHFWGYSGD